MRSYDCEFKIEVVKLANELGSTKASKELKIPMTTLETWVIKARNGRLAGVGSSPKAALSLATENKRLLQEIRELKGF